MAQGRNFRGEREAIFDFRHAENSVDGLRKAIAALNLPISGQLELSFWPVGFAHAVPLENAMTDGTVRERGL
jgi:hypothetical protein